MQDGNAERVPVSESSNAQEQGETHEPFAVHDASHEKPLGLGASPRLLHMIEEAQRNGWNVIALFPPMPSRDGEETLEGKGIVIVRAVEEIPSECAETAVHLFQTLVERVEKKP